jgi:hypothetical protein
MAASSSSVMSMARLNCIWQLGDVARYATCLIFGEHLRHVFVIA